MYSRFFVRKGYNAIAVDLPGHGQSDGQPLGTISDMSVWVANILRLLNIQKTVLVGHSMGSLVAAQLAADRPYVCERIVMLGVSMPMPVSDVLMSAAAGGQHAAFDMANFWSHAKRSDSRSNPGVWKFGLNNRLMERNGTDAFYTDLQACNSFSALATLEVPSLLILGEFDQMTPYKSGVQVGATFSSQIVKIDGAGHAMLTEQPNKVLDALWNFVDL
tara:strand:- start:450 stop:1103 length:654 start_codon:yes stop_codon:yes gene_type:complete